MNEIPNISGSTCEALIKQEYWYKNKKSDDVHILFLKIQNGNWHRFFFDCGVLFWKEVDAPDVFDPKLWQPSPEDFYFPQTEIGHQHGLIGQVIETIEAVDAGQWPELYIKFTNGIFLVLRDFCEYQLLEFRQKDHD